MLHMSRIEQLESMLEESPEDPFLIYALAREYEQVSQTMQAFLMYEHLVTNHPNYVATYYHYAKLLYDVGNHTAAKDLLKQGISSGLHQNDLHAVSEMKGLLMLWGVEDEE